MRLRLCRSIPRWCCSARARRRRPVNSCTRPRGFRSIFSVRINRRCPPTSPARGTSRHDRRFISSRGTVGPGWKVARNAELSGKLRGPGLAPWRSPRPQAPRGDAVMQKTGKVLVVDDYEPNLRGLGQLLEHADYTVFTATNGRDALEIVKTERPDLVLLDVVMPGISGLDVCAELKQNPETCLTPVVLISGAQEREARLAGLDAGADDFLNKPVDPEELYTRVRSLMRLKR